MTSIESDLQNLLVTEREHWEDGPPHELFKRLRAECPVHWTAKITEYPDGGGLLVGHDAPTTSTPSAATGRPTRRSTAASPR